MFFISCVSQTHFLVSTWPELFHKILFYAVFSRKKCLSNVYNSFFTSFCGKVQILRGVCCKFKNILSTCTITNNSLTTKKHILQKYYLILICSYFSNDVGVENFYFYKIFMLQNSPDAKWKRPCSCYFKQKILHERFYQRP